MESVLPTGACRWQRRAGSNSLEMAPHSESSCKVVEVAPCDSSRMCMTSFDESGWPDRTRRPHTRPCTRLKPKVLKKSSNDGNWAINGSSSDSSSLVGAGAFSLDMGGETYAGGGFADFRLF